MHLLFLFTGLCVLHISSIIIWIRSCELLCFYKTKPITIENNSAALLTAIKDMVLVALKEHEEIVMRNVQDVYSMALEKIAAMNRESGDWCWKIDCLRKHAMCLKFGSKSLVENYWTYCSHWLFIYYFTHFSEDKKLS